MEFLAYILLLCVAFYIIVFLVVPAVFVIVEILRYLFCYAITSLYFFDGGAWAYEKWQKRQMSAKNSDSKSLYSDIRL